MSRKISPLVDAVMDCVLHNASLADLKKERRIRETIRLGVTGISLRHIDWEITWLDERIRATSRKSKNAIAQSTSREIAINHKSL